MTLAWGANTARVLHTLPPAFALVLGIGEWASLSGGDPRHSAPWLGRPDIAAVAAETKKPCGPRFRKIARLEVRQRQLRRNDPGRLSGDDTINN
jgi:hypothetical protein